MEAWLSVALCEELVLAFQFTNVFLLINNTLCYFQDTEASPCSDSSEGDSVDEDNFEALSKLMVAVTIPFFILFLSQASADYWLSFNCSSM